MVIIAAIKPGYCYRLNPTTTINSGQESYRLLKKTIQKIFAINKAIQLINHLKVT